MSTIIKRSILNVCVTNYKTKKEKRKVEILKDNSLPKPYIPQGLGKNPDADQRDPAKFNEFIQRWYLSLQGEATPLFSPSDAGKGGKNIYRYDWTFGIALIDGYYWDWQEELEKDSAVAIHLILDAGVANTLEAFPVSATLSVLHPSRKTQTSEEKVLAAVTKTGAKFAKAASMVSSVMELVSAGFDIGENLLASNTGKEKNWFLYQFLDDKHSCPVVEWRINKRVFKEYGPLLRGSLFLSFHGGQQTPAALRLKLRPQIRYCPVNELDFIIPTDELSDDKQVMIEVKPKLANGQ